MSAEHAGNELVVVGFMVFNVAALIASLFWAWRGGYLTGLDDRSTNLHPDSPREEISHG